MALSSSLISQFVKSTNDTTKVKKETTVYGTIKEYDGKKYVKMDGSDLLTPASMTVNGKDEDRVMITIKNHMAVVHSNLTSASANGRDVKAVDSKLGNFQSVVTERLTADEAKIEYIQADNVVIKQTLTANEAIMGEITADNVLIKEELTANKADIETLVTDNATIKESLKATNADIDNLEADNVTIKQTLDAYAADIENLEVKKLDAESADLLYANIDFSNIENAAIGNLLVQAGIIEDLVVGDQTITGRLVGVTISGDLIEGNTIVAEKLVVKGEDGLYYKLNVDGEGVESEQTEYNSLNGQMIMANSITATKIDVQDLVAFDATIGGFSITDNAIYSDVKDSEGNTTRGIYFDKEGQVNIGDADNYIKYIQNEDGTYSLMISAKDIMYNLNGSQRSISDLGELGEYVKIGIFEGEPCIELGERDSDFKLIITNTKMTFMDGPVQSAYFDNQEMHITKAVIDEELLHGNFVWKIRSNGNLGLTWKGGSS